MLTVMVDLGHNFCCFTNIDLSLYYICSLLYYWDDTITQIMYVYCSDTTNMYHFCTPWRCNDFRLFKIDVAVLTLNIMGILKMLIFYVEVLVIFVLLKICLGNPSCSI